MSPLLLIRTCCGPPWRCTESGDVQGVPRRHQKCEVGMPCLNRQSSKRDAQRKRHRTVIVKVNRQLLCVYALTSTPVRHYMRSKIGMPGKALEGSSSNDLYADMQRKSKRL